MTNHSCTPNATSWFLLDHQKTLRTLEPIQKGDEICISYMINELLMPESERSLALTATWHFTCTCRACEDERKHGPEGASAVHRQSVRRLLHTFDASTTAQVLQAIEGHRAADDIQVLKTQLRNRMASGISSVHRGRLHEYRSRCWLISAIIESVLYCLTPNANLDQARHKIKYAYIYNTIENGSSQLQHSTAGQRYLLRTLEAEASRRIDVVKAVTRYLEDLRAEYSAGSSPQR